MHNHNTILLLSVLMISLQACGPGPEVIPADPEWKIYQNESRWKVESTHPFSFVEPYWTVAITANRRWPFKHKYEQFIHLSNLPKQAGRYALVEGFTAQVGPQIPVNILFQEIDWDVLRQPYRINEDADNHISIEQYDPQTKVIKGSFYTEWFREEEERAEVVACEHFRLVLP